MSRRPTDPFEFDADRVHTAAAEPAGADAILGPALPLELPAGAVRRRPDEATPPGEAAVPPPRKTRRAFRLFVATASLLAVGILGVETVSYILALFERNPVLGGGLGALAVMALASGLGAIGWEVLALRRQLRGLQEVADLRGEAARILAEPAGTDRGRMLAARVMARYAERPDLAPRIEQFKRTVSSAHADGEVLSLLAQHIVQPLDAQAYRLVSRAARDAGLGVLLSPAGLLDALLVIWRTSRMIRDVALAYGFRPSRIARLALTRRVLENAAMAGAVEYLGDLLTAHIGAGVAGRISGKVGQGAFTALRTARLGLIAIEACRPLPFTADDRASLAALRKEILSPFAGRNAE